MPKLTLFSRADVKRKPDIEKQLLDGTEWHGLYVFKKEPPINMIMQPCLIQVDEKNLCCRWFNEKGYPEYLNLPKENLSYDNFRDEFIKYYNKNYPHIDNKLPFEPFEFS